MKGIYVFIILFYFIVFFIVFLETKFGVSIKSIRKETLAQVFFLVILWNF